MRLPLGSRCCVTVVCCALAVLPGGCDLGPAFAPDPGAIPVEFRDAQPGKAAVWPDEAWWRGFASPALTGLVETALAHNQDLAAAVARIRQADAQLRIAGASLLPSANATGNASWQRVGAATGSASSRARGGSVDLHSYSAGLNAAYELDFWGKAAAGRQAALANAVFTRFDRQTVALTVATNVATAWFTALALADRIAIATRNLADAQQVLAVVRGRRDAGTANDLDLAQQETFVAASRAALPNLRNQLEQAIVGLGILTGQPPNAIVVRPGSLTDLALPPVAPGLPSELLTRRPDVAAAEAALQAKNANIAVARAAFFPAIQLTGSDGFQAASLGTLIGPGGALMSLAAGLTAPIFDGGTLRGQLELAKGQYDEQLANYRKAVLQAFTDTDNALTAWRYISEQEILEGEAVARAQRAATIARAQMAAGTVDLTTVLTVETTLLNNEDTLAQVRLARAEALLSLYKALGGGWRKADNITLPTLSPNRLEGGVALPIGGNIR